MFVKIPFQISDGTIEHENDIQKSIDSFIDLLVSTQFGHFKANHDFGFVFKNYRFENFDEKKGTIATQDDAEPRVNYKISGTSKNPQNFANELKKSIEKFEPRLRIKEVSMDYNPKKQNIRLQISGQITYDKNREYSHEINFHVW